MSESNPLDQLDPKVLAQIVQIVRKELTHNYTDTIREDGQHYDLKELIEERSDDPVNNAKTLGEPPYLRNNQIVEGKKIYSSLKEIKKPEPGKSPEKVEKLSIRWLKQECDNLRNYCHRNQIAWEEEAKLRVSLEERVETIESALSVVKSNSGYMEM